VVDKPKANPSTALQHTADTLYEADTEEMLKPLLEHRRKFGIQLLQAPRHDIDDFLDSTMFLRERLLELEQYMLKFREQRMLDRPIIMQQSVDCDVVAGINPDHQNLVDGMVESRVVGTGKKRPLSR